MKLPGWEPDREKRALRPPLDLRERLRLAVKVAAVAVVYLWFQDQPASGAAAASAFAAGVGVLSLLELLWLIGTTPRERIFTRTRKQAVVLHAATVVLAAAALLAAVPRLP